MTINRKLADQREVKVKENPLKKVNCPQEGNRDCPAEVRMFTVNQVIAKYLYFLFTRNSVILCSQKICWRIQIQYAIIHVECKARENHFMKQVANNYMPEQRATPNLKVLHTIPVLLQESSLKQTHSQVRRRGKRKCTWYSLFAHTRIYSKGHVVELGLGVSSLVW